MKVYARALEAAVRLDGIARGISERRSDLRDQLQRASASVCLNIAEGAGEFSPAEKVRFYRIARRSASECLAVLDLVERISPVGDMASARDDLQAIGAMLTRVIRVVEDRKRSRGLRTHADPRARPGPALSRALPSASASASPTTPTSP